MAEDVVIRYRAEVDQLTGELKKISVAQTEIINTQKKGEEQTKKNITTQEYAAQQRLKLIKLEEAEIKRLNQLKKLAFDPALIAQYNAQIEQSKNKISQLKSATKSATSGALGAIKSFAGTAAIALGAAFSVSAIIEFGKASAEAFIEAEKNAEKLKFAITTIGGDTEVAFQRLIQQSSELQKITIFSDDSIQQAQTALAQFGLTADQIEELIPKLADFATITSTDIPEAAQKIGAALEGNGREFKKYGIEVSATATRTENLNTILQGLVKYEGSAENATRTLAGELKQAENRAGELEESLGSKLAPVLVKIRTAFLSMVEAIVTSKDELTFENEQKQLKNNAESTLSTLDAVAKEIERIYGISPNEAYIKALEQQIEVETKVQEAASKSNLAGSVQQYNNATQALEILNKELTDFNLKLKAQASAKKALDNRLLSLTELRKKSTEELIKLGEKEKEIGDEVAKQNIKNIDLVIKAREREAEELKKNQELLRKLQIENIDDLKQKRIAQFEEETRNLTAKGQLRADIIKELERQLVDDLNEIDKQRKVDPLFRVPENVPQVPGELDIPADRTSERIEAIEDVEQTWLESNAAILESSQQLFASLAELYSTFAQARLNQIEETKQAELTRIDTALDANEEALQKRRITEVEAENNRKKLEAERLAAEKKAAEESRKIKRKEAILDKANALFQIAINTAQNVAKYPPPNPLGILALATGAAEAAIVVAQPIPYKKGTKAAKGGLSLVGEEGPELTMLPKGTKVLPTRQTKTHSEAIDAMFDNRYESFVLNRYVNPALKAAKKEKAKEEHVTFAENISRSFILNSTGLTEKELEKVRRRGQNINNVDEIARAMAQALKQDPYRR